MEFVVVERAFDPPLTEAEVRALAAEPGCDDLHRVSLLRSYLSSDGRRVICVYRGPDAESVRRANRGNGLPFERAWTASVHMSDD